MLTPEQYEHAKLLMLEAIADQGSMTPLLFALVTAMAVRSKYPQATALDLASVAGDLLDQELIDDGGFFDLMEERIRRRQDN